MAILTACNELLLQPATSYGYSLSPHLGLQSVSTQVTTPVTTPRFEERAQHSGKFLVRLVLAWATLISVAKLCML